MEDKTRKDQDDQIGNRTLDPAEQGKHGNQDEPPNVQREKSRGIRTEDDDDDADLVRSGR